MAGVVRAVIFYLWDDDRKLVFWDRMRIADFVVSDRDRTAPIALARDEPVAHLVRDLFLAVGVFWNEVGFYDR